MPEPGETGVTAGPSIDGWLATAVHLATAAATGGAFPFGAVLVRDGEVVATGMNTARRDADPTGHAETNAIRAACARLGMLDLSGSEIVSSCEPCPLCQAAAALTGITRIVYAATAAEAAEAGMIRTPHLAAMAEALHGAGGVPIERAEPDALDRLAAAGEDHLAPFRAWGAWVAAGGATGTRRHAVQELRLALTAEDFDAALGLYRDVLGLPEAADWDSADGRVHVLDAGRATLEIIDADQAAYVDATEVGRRVAGPIRVALQVDDAPGMAERFIAAGADRLGEPVVTPWGDHNVRLAAHGLQLTLFSPVDD